MPRVLVITARGWYRHLSHTAVVDFEDAMADVADVSWHHLPADAMSRGPRFERSRVEGTYDLALFVAMAPSWLRALRGVRGLREAARSFAVYVFDAWPYQLRSLRRWRRQVSWIDHLFVSYPEAVVPYGERLDCPVHHLAQAASADRFRPDRADRPIDVLSTGRRQEEAHRRLLDLAAREDLLYVFAERDSTHAMRLQDSLYLGGAMARAACAQVSWAVEYTDPKRAAGWSPVTARWFEGAACASVVLGKRPVNPVFDELFPYDRFVVDLDPGAEDFDRVVLAALEREDRAEREALAAHVRSHHSWDARCRAILEAALR